ncbi:MAG: flagellar biosynthesis protein FlgB [Acetobacteraceae bacterium]|nr:flagellar biosynthesis protein FlgB [Acetobacteraceae bacterium]
MDPTDIGLFRLAEKRLNWVEQRQQLLAQNIANAYTPDYKARDLSPFQSSLASVAVARTDPAHLEAPQSVAQGKVQPGRGKAPDGNTVAMEEQLGKVADTASTQELVTNLYHKYQGMFRMVLGHSG